VGGKGRTLYPHYDERQGKGARGFIGYSFAPQSPKGLGKGNIAYHVSRSRSPSPLPGTRTTQRTCAPARPVRPSSARSAHSHGRDNRRTRTRSPVNSSTPWPRTRTQSRERIRSNFEYNDVLRRSEAISLQMADDARWAAEGLPMIFGSSGVIDRTRERQQVLHASPDQLLYPIMLPPGQAKGKGKARGRGRGGGHAHGVAHGRPTRAARLNTGPEPPVAAHDGHGTHRTRRHNRRGGTGST
jgi:hypothetical protein